MASPPYSLPPVLAERWAAARWPSTLGRRTLLRVGLCVPYVALAIWLDLHGIRSAENAQLEQAAEGLGTPITVGAISHAFPPMPLAIARVLPGGAPGLGVVGALCAGGILQLALERLVRAEVPHWLAAVLLVGVGGAPVFWFNAVGDLVGFLGVALFAVAAAGMLDFLYLGRTSAGYAAGLSLALAVLCDPAALVYAGSILLAVPFLAWERFRHEPGSVRSTIAVIAFPSLAVLGAWAFLEWRFTGTVRHPLTLAPQAFTFPLGVAGGFMRAASHVGWQLMAAPVFAVTAVLLLFRRPVAFLALVGVPLDLVVSAWLGLHPSTEQGLVLLGLVGLLAVERRPGSLVSAVLTIETVAGLACSLVLTDTAGTGRLLHVLGL